MKAFVLAAGLGTRLRPWTLEHPKALVPVGGVPMLERVIVNLRSRGFDRIVVNVHHFASQIEDFLASRSLGVDVRISDERARLLDTGGALLHALPLLGEDEEPFLVHNVDILSDADLRALMEARAARQAEAMLLVSPRESSRRLLFDGEMRLRGWRNVATDEYRPSGYVPSGDERELAFSGIYAMTPAMVRSMPERGFSGAFSIIDFFLHVAGEGSVRGLEAPGLDLIDIGKPASLERACRLFGG